MSGKSQSEITRLRTQDEKINAVFSGAGFELIEPDIVQPADIFLEQIGENVRARTYVFSDLEGANLCLRPDLTIPAARYYLDHICEVGKRAKYSYQGPAFRFQFANNDEAQPREFEQAGIELFGGGDQEADETLVLSLAIKAVEAAGLKHYNVRTGDLGIFSVLIDQLDMPDHWAQSLKAKFWRPEMFKSLLDKLSGNQDDMRLPDFAEKLPGLNIGEATILVEQELERESLPAHGLRSVSEIAVRLREKAIDRSLAPLSQDVITLITDYLDINCLLENAVENIEQVTAKAGIDMKADFEALSSRISMFREKGVPLEKCRFCAEFGRNLEYYSGFVFQIEAGSGTGLAAQVAGGGRYDGLLTGLGADNLIPAVGCAIHTERLLAGVADSGGKS